MNRVPLVMKDCPKCGPHIMRHMKNVQTYPNETPEDRWVCGGCGYWWPEFFFPLRTVSCSNGVNP